MCQRTCTVMLVMIAAPTNAAKVVVQPTPRDRVQPLHPRLASRDSDPTVKPRLIIVRGKDAETAAIKEGAAGW